MPRPPYSLVYSINFLLVSHFKVVFKKVKEKGKPRGHSPWARHCSKVTLDFLLRVASRQSRQNTGRDRGAEFRCESEIDFVEKYRK
jgi:hypothetical protein